MIPGFLPEFHPEELLFGMLARHRRLMGSPCAARYNVEMFGNRQTIASVDLPLGLNALGRQLGGVDPVRLAYDHTLFPYYTAFQPVGRREMALDAVITGQGNGLKTWLGVVSYRIRPVEGLRYCPKCVAQSVKQIGEGAWIRSHQLPGNLVCHVHGDTLLTAFLDGRGRHEFWAPGFTSLPMQSGLILDDTVRAKLHLIAVAQAKLVSAGAQAQQANDWGKHYWSRLAETGFVPCQSKVDQDRLESEFRKFYGTALDLLPPSVRSFGESGWLAAMSRYHRKVAHPLFHVLLTTFLDAQTEVAGPFGSGPWPCMNPLADHRGDLRIEQVNHYANRADRVGIFSCDCGHSYTRSISGDGAIGRARFKAGGPLLEAKLRELVVPGAKLREVARICGLDPKTIVREAMSLGLSVPWNIKPSGKAKRFEEKQSPCSSPARSTLPVRRTKRPWETIDRLVSSSIDMVDREIRSRVPVERVTLSSLERESVGVGWLHKRAEKLPHAHNRAQSRIETTKSFQIRRVKHIAAQMEDAQPWQIMRAAGLRGSHLELIERVLSEN